MIECPIGHIHSGRRAMIASSIGRRLRVEGPYEATSGWS